MAQAAQWIDDEHYAVGRWNGVLSIVKFGKTVPTVDIRANLPDFEGVQMIETLSSNQILTSGDNKGMLLWDLCPERKTLTLSGEIAFDSKFGVANSSSTYVYDSICYVIVGHASGWLTIWTATTSNESLGPGDFKLLHSVDLTSDKPTNPWKMQNIRAIALHDSGEGTGNRYVLTGSENGLICVVSVVTGSLVSSTVYNEKAERGINTISLAGNDLAVGNCAVGNNDFNFWYYSVNPADWSVTFTQSINLVKDKTLLQSFCFDIVWATHELGVYFIASTEEGILWILKKDSLKGKFVESISQKENGHLGSALCYRSGKLAATAYDLIQFRAG